MIQIYTCWPFTAMACVRSQASPRNFFLNLFCKSAIRVKSILCMSQTGGRSSVMRSPPARWSRSPCYRSAGHRRFGLRTTLSRGMGWSSGFEWVSGLIRCLTLLAWMTSCTVGIPRSSWIIAMVTCRGASTISRSILDWHLCMIALLDLRTQFHHNSMP